MACFEDHIGVYADFFAYSVKEGLELNPGYEWGAERYVCQCLTTASVESMIVPSEKELVDTLQLLIRTN